MSANSKAATDCYSYEQGMFSVFPEERHAGVFAFLAARVVDWGIR